MLDQLRHRDDFRSREPAPEAAVDRIDLEQLLGAVRRQWLIVAGFVFGFVALAIAYVVSATPFYTATTQLMLDMNNVQLSNSFVDSTMTPSSDAAVTSQIQLLKSQRMARLVIDRLDLTNNKAFMTPPAPGVVGRAFGAIRGLFPQKSERKRTPDEEREARLRFATGKLISNLDTNRVEATFVLRVAFSDPDPAFAQKVAQAYADCYLADQLEAKYESQRQAGSWLQERLEELKTKSQQADLAVQRFRVENNLLATSGQLLSDQQLAVANQQLSDAQDSLARIQAKYDQIQDLIKRGDVNAVVPDALQSSVVTNLRNKYFDAAKMRSEIVGRLGTKHEQVVRQDASMAEFQRLIFQELGRIASSYKNEAAAARGNVELLKARLTSASGVSAVDNTTLVQLRELQQESDSYRTLYQSFLQRLQQTVQQQSFPISDARIVDRASALSYPTSPRTAVILLLAIVLGGTFGGLVGSYREFRDRVFRTGDQIRAASGVRFLGYLPTLPRRAIAPPRAPAHPAEIRKNNALLDYSVQQPFSSATETLRNAMVVIDQMDDRGGPRLIGVVSVLPDEGKTTLAVNLAELLAASGSRTLLIDCDLRNPSLTKSVAPHRAGGIQDHLAGDVPLHDLMLENPATGLRVIATAPGPTDTLAKYITPEAIDRLRLDASEFKYVVLDLAPIAATADARQVAPFIDAFVMVVEWGRTARRAVKTTLENEPLISQRCAGLILNKVNMRKMSRYQTYGSTEYYHKRIAAYYERV